MRLATPAAVTFFLAALTSSSAPVPCNAFLSSSSSSPPAVGQAGVSVRPGVGPPRRFHDHSYDQHWHKYLKAAAMDDDGSEEFLSSTREAYDAWRARFQKGPFDAERFQHFQKNYRALMEANAMVAQRARELRRPAPPPRRLNEFGDCSPEEFMAIKQESITQAQDEDPDQDQVYGPLSSSSSRPSSKRSIPSISTPVARTQDQSRNFFLGALAGEPTVEIDFEKFRNELATDRADKIKNVYRDYIKFFSKTFNEARMEIFGAHLRQLERQYFATGANDRWIELNELADLTTEEAKQLQENGMIESPSPSKVRPQKAARTTKQLKSNTSRTPIDRAREVYNEWCKYYDKDFDEQRLEIFRANFEQVERHYRRTGKTVNLNEFADLTAEEYNLLLQEEEVAYYLLGGETKRNEIPLLPSSSESSSSSSSKMLDRQASSRSKPTSRLNETPPTQEKKTPKAATSPTRNIPTAPEEKIIPKRATPSSTETIPPKSKKKNPKRAKTSSATTIVDTLPNAYKSEQDSISNSYLSVSQPGDNKSGWKNQARQKAQEEAAKREELRVREEARLEALHEAQRKAEEQIKLLEQRTLELAEAEERLRQEEARIEAERQEQIAREEEKRRRTEEEEHSKMLAKRRLEEFAEATKKKAMEIEARKAAQEARLAAFAEAKRRAEMQNILKGRVVSIQTEEENRLRFEMERRSRAGEEESLMNQGSPRVEEENVQQPFQSQKPQKPQSDDGMDDDELSRSYAQELLDHQRRIEEAEAEKIAAMKRVREEKEGKSERVMRAAEMEKRRMRRESDEEEERRRKQAEALLDQQRRVEEAGGERIANMNSVREEKNYFDEEETRFRAKEARAAEQARERKSEENRRRIEEARIRAERDRRDAEEDDAPAEPKNSFFNTNSLSSIFSGSLFERPKEDEPWAPTDIDPDESPKVDLDGEKARAVGISDDGVVAVKASSRFVDSSESVPWSSKSRSFGSEDRAMEAEQESEGIISNDSSADEPKSDQSGQKFSSFSPFAGSNDKNGPETSDDKNKVDGQTKFSSFGSYVSSIEKSGPPKSDKKAKEGSSTDGDIRAFPKFENKGEQKPTSPFSPFGSYTSSVDNSGPPKSSDEIENKGGKKPTSPFSPLGSYMSDAQKVNPGKDDAPGVEAFPELKKKEGIPSFGAFAATTDKNSPTKSDDEVKAEPTSEGEENEKPSTKPFPPLTKNEIGSKSPTTTFPPFGSFSNPFEKSSPPASKDDPKAELISQGEENDKPSIKPFPPLTKNEGGSKPPTTTFPPFGSFANSLEKSSPPASKNDPKAEPSSEGEENDKPSAKPFPPLTKNEIGSKPPTTTFSPFGSFANSLEKSGPPTSKDEPKVESNSEDEEKDTPSAKPFPPLTKNEIGSKPPTTASSPFGSFANSLEKSSPPTSDDEVKAEPTSEGEENDKPSAKPFPPLTKNEIGSKPPTTTFSPFGSFANSLEKSGPPTSKDEPKVESNSEDEEKDTPSIKPFPPLTKNEIGSKPPTTASSPFGSFANSLEKSSPPTSDDEVKAEPTSEDEEKEKPSAKPFPPLTKYEIGSKPPTTTFSPFGSFAKSLQKSGLPTNENPSARLFPELSKTEIDSNQTSVPSAGSLSSGVVGDVKEGQVPPGSPSVATGDDLDDIEQRAEQRRRQQSERRVSVRKEQVETAHKLAEKQASDLVETKSKEATVSMTKKGSVPMVESEKERESGQSELSEEKVAAEKQRRAGEEARLREIAVRQAEERDELRRKDEVAKRASEAQSERREMEKEAVDEIQLQQAEKLRLLAELDEERLQTEKLRRESRDKEKKIRLADEMKAVDWEEQKARSSIEEMRRQAVQDDERRKIEKIKKRAKQQSEDHKRRLAEETRIRSLARRQAQEREELRLQEDRQKRDAKGMEPNAKAAFNLKGDDKYLDQIQIQQSEKLRFIMDLDDERLKKENRRQDAVEMERKRKLTFEMKSVEWEEQKAWLAIQKMRRQAIEEDGKGREDVRRKEEQARAKREATEIKRKREEEARLRGIADQQAQEREELRLYDTNLKTTAQADQTSSPDAKDSSETRLSKNENDALDELHVKQNEKFRLLGGIEERRLQMEKRRREAEETQKKEQLAAELERVDLEEQKARLAVEEMRRQAIEEDAKSKEEAERKEALARAKREAEELKRKLEEEARLREIAAKQAQEKAALVEEETLRKGFTPSTRSRDAAKNRERQRRHKNIEAEAQLELNKMRGQTEKSDFLPPSSYGVMLNRERRTNEVGVDENQDSEVASSAQKSVGQTEKRARRLDRETERRSPIIEAYEEANDPDLTFTTRQIEVGGDENQDLEVASSTQKASGQTDKPAWRLDGETKRRSPIIEASEETNDPDLPFTTTKSEVGGDENQDLEVASSVQKSVGQTEKGARRLDGETKRRSPIIEASEETNDPDLPFTMRQIEVGGGEDQDSEVVSSAQKAVGQTEKGAWRLEGESKRMSPMIEATEKTNDPDLPFTTTKNEVGDGEDQDSEVVSSAQKASGQTEDPDIRFNGESTRWRQIIETIEETNAPNLSFATRKNEVVGGENQDFEETSSTQKISEAPADTSLLGQLSKMFGDFSKKGSARPSPTAKKSRAQPAAVPDDVAAGREDNQQDTKKEQKEIIARRLDQETERRRPIIEATDETNAPDLPFTTRQIEVGGGENQDSEVASSAQKSFGQTEKPAKRLDGKNGRWRPIIEASEETNDPDLPFTMRRNEIGGGENQDLEVASSAQKASGQTDDPARRLEAERRKPIIESTDEPNDPDLPFTTRKNEVGGGENQDLEVASSTQKESGQTEKSDRRLEGQNERRRPIIEATEKSNDPDLPLTDYLSAKRLGDELKLERAREISRLKAEADKERRTRETQPRKFDMPEMPRGSAEEKATDAMIPDGAVAFLGKSPGTTQPNGIKATRLQDGPQPSLSSNSTKSFVTTGVPAANRSAASTGTKNGEALADTSLLGQGPKMFGDFSKKDSARPSPTAEKAGDQIAAEATDVAARRAENQQATTQANEETNARRLDEETERQRPIIEATDEANDPELQFTDHLSPSGNGSSKIEQDEDQAKRREDELKLERAREIARLKAEADKERRTKEAQPKKYDLPKRPRVSAEESSTDAMEIKVESLNLALQKRSGSTPNEPQRKFSSLDDAELKLQRMADIARLKAEAEQARLERGEKLAREEKVSQAKLRALDAAMKKKNETTPKERAEVPVSKSREDALRRERAVGLEWLKEEAEKERRERVAKESRLPKVSKDEATLVKSGNETTIANGTNGTGRNITTSSSFLAARVPTKSTSPSSLGPVVEKKNMIPNGAVAFLGNGASNRGSRETRDLTRSASPVTTQPNGDKLTRLEEAPQPPLALNSTKNSATTGGSASNRSSVSTGSKNGEAPADTSLLGQVSKMFGDFSKKGSARPSPTAKKSGDQLATEAADVAARRADNELATKRAKEETKELIEIRESLVSESEKLRQQRDSDNKGTEGVKPKASEQDGKSEQPNGLNFFSFFGGESSSKGDKTAATSKEANEVRAVEGFFFGSFKDGMKLPSSSFGDESKRGNAADGSKASSSQTSTTGMESQGLSDDLFFLERLDDAEELAGWNPEDEASRPFFLTSESPKPNGLASDTKPGNALPGARNSKEVKKVPTGTHESVATKPSLVTPGPNGAEAEKSTVSKGPASGSSTKKSSQNILFSMFSFDGFNGMGGSKDAKVKAQPTTESSVGTKSSSSEEYSSNVASIARWWQNSDGSITGFVSNKEGFKDGTRITTPPLPKGTKPKPGEIVETEGGTRYLLV